MNYFVFVVALCAALIAGATPGLAGTENADFTGTWVLDADRSEGLPPGMGQHTMTVKQSGDRINVEIHIQGAEGEQTVPDEYVLDGKETDFQPRLNVEASATGKRTSRWSEDHNGFEAREHATVEGPNGEITITASRRWRLAADGDMLTIEMTVSGPQGEMTSTRVYTRQ